MIKEILYKLFRIEPLPCNTCEVLRGMLEQTNSEKKYLLEQLLKEPEIIQETSTEEFKPIKTTKFTPWHVRRQILEAEDRKQAQIIKDKKKEMEEAAKLQVDKLEKELGVQ